MARRPAKPGDLFIPQDSVPGLRILAEGLSRSVGKKLNYAHAYVALMSAQQAGALPVTPDQAIANPGNPAVIETLANLLRRGSLLEELLAAEGLKDADKGGRSW